MKIKLSDKFIKKFYNSTWHTSSTGDSWYRLSWHEPINVIKFLWKPMIIDNIFIWLEKITFLDTSPIHNLILFDKFEIRNLDTSMPNRTIGVDYGVSTIKTK